MTDPMPALISEANPIKSINGRMLQKLIKAGLTWLRTNQQIVNTLNVFPVPDGDTGTNMVLTMQAAYDEIKDSKETNFGKMAHLVAHGALMGARGNSGVILSQLWRGFARALDDLPVLENNDFARALAEARDTAYKGVVRPVEGTILTVAKDIAAEAELITPVTEDFIDMLERVVQAADRSVQNTPALLPVLKEAGVVDSGGKGLYFILDGMLRYIKGQALDISIGTVQPLSEMVFLNTLETVEPGQDYEVIVDFRPHNSLDLPVFYGTLEQMGTSIQVGEGEGIYRLHIHVPTPNLYSPIDYTRSIGTVTKVAIENLVDQMENKNQACDETQPIVSPIEPGQIAVVAVCPGAGIARVFASLGVSAVVDGGQSMNPSTQMITQAFENLPTDKIIILPNNKNIILAANAAREVSVKDVAVVPSKSVPQGLAAMMCLIPDGDFESVVKEMEHALAEVQTGEITFATRKVEIDGVQVEEGQIIALLNGKLICSCPNVEEALLSLLSKAHAEQYELITLFHGADILKTEAASIAENIQAHFQDQVVEVQEGCQPHYHFIVAIE